MADPQKTVKVETVLHRGVGHESLGAPLSPPPHAEKMKCKVKRGMMGGPMCEYFLIGSVWICRAEGVEAIWPPIVYNH